MWHEGVDGTMMIDAKDDVKLYLYMGDSTE